MLARKSVYLIDDDPIVNFYNRDVLEELEYFNEITEFSSAVDALENISIKIKNKECLPAYIFVDVRMPEMDGFEFIEELEYLIDDHEIKELPVVLIVTSSEHKRDLELFDKCQIAGFYINKPLDEDDLRSKLNI